MNYKTNSFMAGFNQLNTFAKLLKPLGNGLGSWIFSDLLSIQNAFRECNLRSKELKIRNTKIENDKAMLLNAFIHINSFLMCQRSYHLP